MTINFFDFSTTEKAEQKPDWPADKKKNGGEKGYKNYQEGG